MSQAEKEIIPDHLEDCQNLTATALRERYPLEASSHRNLKQRAKNQGKSVHPEFISFRSFLEHVGPRPCPGATLDRIDNADPEYGPGKVRWADKRTQNSNKGDTLLFHYSRTGDTYTAFRLGKLQKVSPTTIRKRRERGWTDDEIVEGRRHAQLAEAHDNPGISIPHARVPRPRRETQNSAKDILYQRNSEYAAFHRAEYGEEYCIADFEYRRDSAAEVGISISQEAYKRFFAKWWKEQKPHLILERMPKWAQELIDELEGPRARMPGYHGPIF
jgi:hypothetical protein